MADIGNIGPSVGSGLNTAGVRSPIDAFARRSADSATSTTSRSASSDRVEVSEVARWLSEMDRLPAIRESKVAAAKAAIAAGTLDTDEKLNIALGRMIDEIG